MVAVGATRPVGHPVHGPRVTSMFRLSITILLFSLNACGSDMGPIDDGTPEPIEKSAKRGLAYNLTQAADFEALREGVSWWYNWHFTTSTPAGYVDDHQMEFIPMLWGRNADGDYTQAMNFILAHPEVEYLLVMNEPNLTDQANLTPAQAAADWPRYEQLIADLATEGRAVKLVGPAMTWGTMPDYSDPVDWLDAFLSAYRDANGGRDPRIDYLAFHWYDYGLEAQLNRLQKYGKPIWITEMANWNDQIDSYAEQIAQMSQMVALCESRDDVFRYAWFIGRGSGADSHHTYLFTQTPGELTDLGLVYVNLPYAE
jgi:hypothetical protein